MIEKIKKKESIALLVGFVALLTLHTLYIPQLNLPYVNYDEYGYWGIAAFLAGYDWSDLLSNYCAYYSFGYSLLLFPLFLIFDNTTTMYHAALFVNAILLSLLFLFIYKILKQTLKGINGKAIYLLALCLSCYPSYLVQGYMAWTETLNLFLVWIIIYLFYMLEFKSEKVTLIIILLSIISGYLYWVHQRNIGIVLAVLSTLLLLYLKKQIRKKNILIFTILITTFLILNILIANYLKNNIWINPQHFGNEYQSILNKTLSLFANDGIKHMLYTFSGQLFYIGASSLLFGYIGLYWFVNKIYIQLSSQKQKTIIDKIKNIQLAPSLFIFIFLGFVFTFIISIIFHSGKISGSGIIYGRLNDPFIVPIAMIGIYAIFKDKVFNEKIVLIINLVFGILGFIAKQGISTIKEPLLNSTSAIGMSAFFDINNIKIGLLFTVVSLVFWFIYYIIKYKYKKNIIIAASYIMIFAFEFANFSHVLIDDLIYASNINSSIQDVSDYLKTNQNKSIYVNSKTNALGLLQFILYNTKINFTDDGYNLDNKNILLIDKIDNWKSLKLQKEYNYNGRIGKLDIWLSSEEPLSSDQTDEILEIPLSLFTLHQGSLKDNTIISNGEEGFLTSGPYINLPVGNYKVIINYNLLDHDDNNTAYFEIASNFGTFNKVWIPIEQKGQNTVVEIPITINHKNEDFEIRSFCSIGSLLNIYSISLKHELYRYIRYIPINELGGGIGKIEQNYIFNQNMDDDFLLLGPYIPLPADNYILNMEFMLENAEDFSEIGYVDIASNGYVYTSVSIDKINFSNNKYTLVLPFTLSADTKNLEFRFFCKGGVPISAGNVSVHSAE